MDKDDLAELQHLHNSWVEHKYTQTFVTSIKEELRDAFRGLQSVCSVTTDPRVASAYTHWSMLTKLLKLIKEGPRDDGQTEQ